MTVDMLISETHFTGNHPAGTARGRTTIIIKSSIQHHQLSNYSQNTFVIAVETIQSLSHTNYKPAYLQFNTSLTNGEWKPTLREMCPLVHINTAQLPQAEDVKYLGLYLDRRLSWHKHIFAKQKLLWITLTKMYWLLGHKTHPTTSSKFLIYEAILNPI
jgi:hypothetical protein